MDNNSELEHLEDNSKEVADNIEKFQKLILVLVLSFFLLLNIKYKNT